MFENFKDTLSYFPTAIQCLPVYKYFDFYYLIEIYNIVMRDHKSCIDAWIYRNDEKWCVGFFVEGLYLLNGSSNLSDKDILKIRDKIDFNNIIDIGENLEFMGNTDLLNNLSNIIKPKFALESSIKERFFYVANQLNFDNNTELNISLMNKNDDVNEVGKLYQQYYVEEYAGKNNKNIDAVINNVNYLIENSAIYKLIVEDRIIGFCTTMNFISGRDNMVGTIFIDENYRNRKYGQGLLAYVSNKLLEINPEIYLMTTKENISSNKMVENLGFVRCYEHSDRICHRIL